MPQIEAATTAGLVIVGGPTGCGKTSIISSLLVQYPERFVRAPSFTTRSKRLGETEAEYTFVDRETLLNLHAKGDLLNLDSVYGNLYGMSREGVEAIVASGRFAIKEVHPRNHPGLRAYCSGVVSVLLQRLGGTVHGDASETWDAERHARLSEDAAFYRDLDLTPFDIIRTVSPPETPAEVARHLHVTISAVAATRLHFPPPGEIDAFNAQGYSLVAHEFLDERRVTTSAFHQLSASYFQHTIKRFAVPGTRVLELGPGSGWLRRCFEWPDVEYTGIELVQGMVEAHASHTPGELSIATVRAMPVPSSHFDVIFASLADPFSYPAAWCEIWRVLRPGGQFIFSAPAAEWATALRNSESQNRTVFSLENGQEAEVFSFTFTEEGLRTGVESCGFDMIEFHAFTGAMLGEGHPVPIAFSKAADQAGVSLRNLPVLNCAIARKPGEAFR